VPNTQFWAFNKTPGHDKKKKRGGAAPASVALRNLWPVIYPPGGREHLCPYCGGCISAPCPPNAPPEDLFVPDLRNPTKENTFLGEPSLAHGPKPLTIYTG